MSDTSLDLTERVESALRGLEDPRLGMNVFEAGLVHDIRTDGASVVVEADLQRFDPRSTDEVLQAMLSVVDGVEGVESAHVEQAGLDGDDRASIAEVDNVLAVASTKGGVGKTTVAVHLACALAGKREVGLFDADIFGPNVPSLLDLDGPIRADEKDRPHPISVGDLEVMSVGLMTDGGPLAWRGAMAHDALSDLFADTAWSNTDTLVIDLPPGTSDVLLTTIQEILVDGVVLVTTPFHTSVEDTRRSVELFEENGVPVLGMAVNMERFVCECGREHDLFPGADPAGGLDVPVLARLPFDREMQADPRPGTAPDPILELAEDVRDRLRSVDRIEVPGDAVDLRGCPPRERRELVREAFTELDPGDELYVVSDHDPSAAGEFLVELLDESGRPEDVLGEFAVDRHGPDEWVLVARHP